MSVCWSVHAFHVLLHENKKKQKTLNKVFALRKSKSLRIEAVTKKITKTNNNNIKWKAMLGGINMKCEVKSSLRRFQGGVKSFVFT